MFAKGSRYRNLPESSSLDAAGERQRGKEWRLIVRPESRFEHTVQDNDRLDLLAYKYYGDGTRWWQIADANPTPAFPLELLDLAPLVAEEWTLRSVWFSEQMPLLLTDLASFGDVQVSNLTFWDLKAPPPFDARRPSEPDFLEATVVVHYPPAIGTHQKIVDAINSRFHFLRAFAWDAAGQTTELFAFEDPVAKANWRDLIDQLSATPGMMQVVSQVTDGIVSLVYDAEMVARETLLSLISKSDFAMEPGSRTITRVGSTLAIPPNQIT